MTVTHGKGPEPGPIASNDVLAAGGMAETAPASSVTLVLPNGSPWP